MHVAYIALLGHNSSISLFLRRSSHCDCRGSVTTLFGVLTSNSLTAGVSAKDVRGGTTQKQ